MQAAPQDQQVGARGLGLRFLELFALSGIAIAQPFLDVLGKNAELLVSHRTTGLQGVVIALGVIALPPFVLLCAELLVGLVAPSWVNRCHTIACGLLALVIGLEVLKHQTTMGAAALVIGAIAIGMLGAFVVWRFDAVRQFLHYLAFAPVVFAVLFLVSSPAGEVLFGDGTPATSATTSRTPHRVVLVVLDELPEASLLDGNGHIDRELYPNFARLESTSTFYRNTSTVAAFTEGAVPAIATGSYPADRDKLPDVKAYPRNLFTLLGKQYDMNVHEPITHLCPPSYCESSANPGFADLVRQSVDLWRDYAAPKREVKKFSDANAWRSVLPNTRAFVQSLSPADAQRLDFLHVELPHYPWHYVQSLQSHRYVPGDPPGEAYLGLWPDSGGLVSARQRHLVQVQATDTLLGEILDKLERIGAFDDALVVVTADHGVSFEPNEPARNPSAKNAAGVAWPPLFVKYPGQRATKIDDRPALSVDIMPTIADVTGTEIPWSVDGRSLRGEPRPEGVRRLYPWTWLPTEKDLEPAAGNTFVEVDGKGNFETVVRSRAAVANGPPELRIYRNGPFGRLIGEQASTFTRRAGASSAHVDDAEKFHAIDAGASRAEWLWNIGSITDVVDGQPLAITLGDRIVAVTTAQPSVDGTSPFTFLVPPSLVRAGRNELGVHVVRGTAQQPVLESATLR